MRAWLPILAGIALQAAEPLVLTGAGAVGGATAVAAGGMQAGGAVVAWSGIAVAALPRQPAAACSGGVVTCQGEILRGLPGDTDQGALRWTSDLGGARSQPLDGVAAIILAPVDLDALPTLLAGGPGVLLVNGERVAGKLAFLNAEAVGLDTGRRVAQLPRGRVSAIVLRGLQAAEAPCTWLLLASGDRVLAGGSAEPPPESVVAAWRDGPGSALLAAQPPKRAQAADRLGAALPIRPGIGFPARVGGLATPTGVRLPARGEIAWAAAGFNQFVGWAACPDGAQPTSAAVVLDGTVAWEQTLQPGAPAVAMTLPLRGAAELVLRAAPLADGETAQRQVVWGMPMLVR